MRILVLLLLFAPAAFSAVTCPSGVNHCAQLTWTAPTVGTATGYKIYRSLVNGGCVVLTSTSCVKVGTAVAPTFLDSPLTAKVTYYWVITATDAVSESTGTPQAIATMPDDSVGQPGLIIIQVK